MKIGGMIAILLAVVLFIVTMPLIGRAAAGECNITTTMPTTTTATTDLGDVVCFVDTDQNGYFGDVDSLCVTNPGFAVYTDVIQWIDDNSTLSADSYNDPWTAFVTWYVQYDGVAGPGTPMADFTNFENLRLIVIQVIE
jgi:hypothetical protein